MVWKPDEGQTADCVQLTDRDGEAEDIGAVDSVRIVGLVEITDAEQEDSVGVLLLHLLVLLEYCKHR